ncbi:low temperature requirement protein A [Longispora fulva]|uniref:Low temperature requirement protein LtrA n=1 Tax=Longispora fulva TaxID=619741 RepID=A0A8J7GLA0_9ACTN|nr:low temperature requirement protein A [Longispora fulva]MBG6140291.1 low temperature requirement protein LtrA [Longispora fulva]GIG57329.1 low temperature requirement protein A [Longispora fulva]
MTSSPHSLALPADRASTLELFFDLVFVFTITQLTTKLAGDPTPLGFGRIVIMLGIIWWMYSGYVWLTNSVRMVNTVRRVLLLTGMTGFLVVALAIPEAYGSTGLAFGLGYFVVNAVHSGLFLTSQPGAWKFMRWLAPENLFTAGLVLVGGWLHLPWLWVAAFALQAITPYLHSTGHYNVQAGHFVERHGLVLIIALGESVVAIGVGAFGLPVTWQLVAAAALGLTLAYHLWWCYFARDDEHAAEALAAIADPGRRSRSALHAFGYAYVPMLLGVIAMAAGVKKAMGHATAHSGFRAAVVLAGGVALFLIGEAYFRHVLKIGAVGWRALGGVVAMATVPLGVQLNPLVQLVALIAVFVAVFVTEEVLRTGRTARQWRH